MLCVVVCCCVLCVCLVDVFGLVYSGVFGVAVLSVVSVHDGAV